MSSTRNIRRRIKSVKNTSQITKAMQMVAASKMRKAQDAALAGHAYATQMDNLLSLFHSGLGQDVAHPFLQERENKRPGVLLVTTDKGLCGALNTNLFREVAKLPPETEFVTIGRKGKLFLARTKRNLIADFEVPETPTMIQVKHIFQFMIDRYLEGKIDSINIYFTRFINTLTQVPTNFQVLPLTDIPTLGRWFKKDIHDIEEDAVQMKKHHREIKIEPTPSEVLDRLLPYCIQFVIYQFILDAQASEHSARMVAMKNATENAKSIIKELTLEYNRARQNAITTELLEITTAQMALS